MDWFAGFGRTIYVTDCNRLYLDCFLFIREAIVIVYILNQKKNVYVFSNGNGTLTNDIYEFYLIC